jgi:ABC-2 type transport system ATP-binding protein
VTAPPPPPATGNGTEGSANGPVIAIDARGLTKRYAGRTVVDALTMQVRRGEIYGFLGPNGSGKTTSIRMMCGLLTPDAGSGFTLGLDMVRDAAAIKARVGYMTQRFGLYDDLSIAENLSFVARVYRLDRRRERVASALDRLGLSSRSGQLAGRLSGGWKQRLALAACMLHEPELLLLDEPTAGVDPSARRDFWNEIHGLAARGVTVLVSTHYMDEAERCHRLGYIAYGRLLALGTPAELVAGSGLAARRIDGAVGADLVARLEADPRAITVTRLGASLRVCGAAGGSDGGAAELDAAIAAAVTPPSADPSRPGTDGDVDTRLTVAAVPPSLEEVFIARSRAAVDNMAGAA